MPCKSSFFESNYESCSYEYRQKCIASGANVVDAAAFMNDVCDICFCHTSHASEITVAYATDAAALSLPLQSPLNLCCCCWYSMLLLLVLYAAAAGSLCCCCWFSMLLLLVPTPLALALALAAAYLNRPLICFHTDIQ